MLLQVLTFKPWLQRVKKGKRIEVKFPALRSSALGVIEHTALERKAYDRVHALLALVSRIVLATIASCLAPWSF